MQLRNSGTLGDTYISICHWVGISQKFSVEHYTRHTYWQNEIRDIYALLPNFVGVTFPEDSHKRTWSSPYSYVNKKIDEFEPFPNFKFPPSKLDPGEPYIALCPKSGRPDQGRRRIPTSEVNRIIAEADMPIVTPESGKTTLLEAMGLVARSNRFYGFQGLMSFVAMSHKSQSVVYVGREKEWLALRNRTARPWIKFLDEVKI
jgi:hypothetical protein